MRRVEVSRRELDVKALKMRRPREDDHDLVLHEPVEVYDEGGQLLVVMAELTGYESILGALRRVTYRDTARGLRRIKPKDGSGKRRNDVARIVGFQPRYPLRRDYCTTASLATDQPKEHSTICGWAPRVSEVFARVNPEKHTWQKELVTTKVKPCWRIADVFTSGICNRNNALPYHLDTGNFPGAWSGMLAFSRDMKGGLLVMPEYRVAFSFEGAWLILFDGQSVLHGVSPFVRNSTLGYRYTLVYYALQQMCHCGTPAEELARIRSIKTERELARLDPAEVERRIGKAKGKKLEDPT